MQSYLVKRASLMLIGPPFVDSFLNGLAPRGPRDSCHSDGYPKQILKVGDREDPCAFAVIYCYLWVIRDPSFKGRASTMPFQSPVRTAAPVGLPGFSALNRLGCSEPDLPSAITLA